MRFILSLLTFLLATVVVASFGNAKLPASRVVSPTRHFKGQSTMLFDFLKPKKSASASHILVKGESGPAFLTKLKGDIMSSKNIPEKFAQAAAQHSACPSAKNGGSLGNFKQGQMVPAFDKVVFSESVGVVHGPIKTPFGAHLILIESRSD